MLLNLIIIFVNFPSSRRPSSLSQKLSTSKRDMRVARTIFIIFLLIMICSVPVAVIHLIDKNAENKNRFLLVHILYWIQYCVNVLIYVLMNRQYRDAYIEAVCKVIPSWQRHKKFRFFWEAASHSSRPQNQPNNSSIRSRKGSLNDQTQITKETDPRSSAGYSKSGRLSVIAEKTSTSGGDEALLQDSKTQPIRPLPLATPPPTMRNTHTTPISNSPPLTPFAENQFASLSDSPPKQQVPTSKSASCSPTTSPLSSPTVASSSKEYFKTMIDKLDTISVSSSTPLQQEGCEMNDLDKDQQPSSSENNKQECYTTTHGASLQQTENAVSV